MNENDLEFGSSFPYLALPHSGSTTAPRGTGGGVSSNSAAGAPSSDAPSGGVSTGFGGLAGDGLPVLPVTVALVGLALAGAGVVLRRRTA